MEGTSCRSLWEMFVVSEHESIQFNSITRPNCQAICLIWSMIKSQILSNMLIPLCLRLYLSYEAGAQFELLDGAYITQASLLGAFHAKRKQIRKKFGNCLCTYDYNGGTHSFTRCCRSPSI